MKHWNFKILLLLASAVGLLVAGGLVTAQDGALLVDANSGIFTGTDSNGDFQVALEAAVAAAEAAAGCCDQRIEYSVLGTSGQRGGLVFVNDITVTIKAVIN